MLELLAYLFAWITLYFGLCLRNPQRSYEWHCRTVTIIHGVLISVLALYGAFYGGPWPFTHAGGPNNAFQVRTVNICLAYFLFDFSWCIFYKTEGLVMLLHHILSVVGLSVCLFQGRYGTEVIATIAGAEVTNPLLQIRWFLRATGQDQTLAADLLEVLFAFSFGFLRLGMGGLLLYCYFKQNTDWLPRFGGVSLYIISLIFFANIVNHLRRKYSQRCRRWSDPPDKEVSQPPDKDVSSVGIIKEQEIPSQRDIKSGLDGLNLRKNCMVQNLPEMS